MVSNFAIDRMAHPGVRFGYDRNTTVVGLFDQMAGTRPGDVAIEGPTGSLTYSGLRHRSEQLARVLRRAGVGQGDLVGVVLGRSADLIVAVLAILRAGAAYVPVLADQPQARVRAQLTAASVRVTVTDRTHADLTGPGCIALDAEGSLLTGVLPNGPHPVDQQDAGPEDLAYVMFTSGSTGAPRGVEVTHRNVVRLVRGQNYADFRPDAVFVQLSSPAFDAATFEIWGALLNGARLVIPPDTDTVLDDFPAFLQKHRITHLFLTTPLFHTLVDTHLDDLAAVPEIHVGGDTMSLAKARVLAARSEPGTRVGNNYGPTETTTFATYFDIDELTDDMTSVPLGRPIAHTSVYVLDEDRVPCAPGETGEICIGGDGVTRGYLGEPELTRDRFVPDPFAADDDARMYRTGDIGRLRPDGLIEFLGRAGRQVKIRGFRVEPGEIEKVLADHPRVQHAAVVAMPGPEGATRLAAYITGAASAEEVMSHLRNLLPDYMVPHFLVPLRTMPLTTTGKLDRAALPPPSRQAPPPQAAITETERRMTQIWQRVLQVDGVGVDDNFFALGGDSLLVLRCVAAAAEEGIDVTIAQVFRAPTVRQLCGSIAPSPGYAAGHPLLSERDRSVLPDDVVDAYPATSMQLGMIFEADLSPDGSVYHDGVSVLVRARLDEDVLREVFRRIGERHDVLRTRFNLTDFTEPLQLVTAEPRIPLSLSDARGLNEQAQHQILERRRQELMTRFDVEVAPLLRVHAMASSDDTFHLVLAFHHAIMDGWGESVLLYEFAVAYEAGLRGQAADLPSLGDARYRQLTELERAALRSDETVQFWEERCRRGTPVLAAGTPRTTASTERVSSTVEIPAQTFRSLAAVARACEVPLKSVLLAGHLAVLRDWAGVPDPVSGVVVNGRPEVTGGDRLIGLFLNVVPVRVETTGRSWTDLIAAAAHAERELLPHRWFPYAEIHRMAGGPLFDVVFNYVRFHQFAEIPEDGSVQLETLEVRDKSSVPLMVDVVHDPWDRSLAVELHGAAPLWTTDKLGEWADRYVEKLDQIAYGGQR